MERQIEVMNRMLALSVTCQEAVLHIKSRLNEGQFESTSMLMSDVVEGFYHLEQALANLSVQLPPNNIEQVVRQLQQSLQHIVTAYEQGQPGQVLEKLQFNLEPALHRLHRELELALHPYTLS